MGMGDAAVRCKWTAWGRDGCKRRCRMKGRMWDTGSRMLMEDTGCGVQDADADGGCRMEGAGCRWRRGLKVPGCRLPLQMEDASAGYRG